MSPVFHFGLFAVVGLANTIIDFVVFNWLTGKRMNMPRIPANWISTTVGMGFSFTVNSLLLFHGAKGSVLSQLAAFFATNAISMYVIQTGVLWLMLHRFPLPATWLSAGICSRLPIAASSESVRRNIAKVMATAASLAYNYCSYSLWVFR